jgi:hypothetical protein
MTRIKNKKAVDESAALCFAHRRTKDACINLVAQTGFEPVTLEL